MLYLKNTENLKDMIEKLDYAMVPTGFVHCFNENCKNANRCLRHQIVRFIPDTLWAVSIVNPARTSPTGKCAAFMADTPVQYAVGMDHLLDQIPYLEAKRIKQRLLMTYGKNKFYQFKRKERTFSPEDQQVVDVQTSTIIIQYLPFIIDFYTIFFSCEGKKCYI